MSTQQDIYAAGSENRPPMLNKENYVPWSSRLLRYAKSRPNGKLIYNSIMNGPYVRRMIPEPGDNRIVKMEADDQAIQTILLGLPEDIYAAVDSCETAQEIWLRVQQMMKGSDIGIQEKKAKLFNEWERICYPGMNLGQDRQIQMVRGNGGNQFRQYVGQNVRNQNGLGKIGVQNIGNGNVVAARAEGNAPGNNGNQIRCYNCRGLGHLARNCTVRPRRRDAAYLQTQLLIAQKEEAGSNFQAERKHRIGVSECNAPVYDSDGSAEEGGTVDQHPATVEETRAYFESLYNNLALEVEKVNSVNQKMKETNADLTTELARYKNQEKCFEISQENMTNLKDVIKRREISNLSKQLSTEKSTVSSLLEEKKKLKSDFKIREDELLDKQIQLENKIKELDNILVKTGQSIQTMTLPFT
ncbi:retrovirus-related pol polyprotein from transposon TNT 1-94 [Tanacetum coccineum]